MFSKTIHKCRFLIIGQQGTCRGLAWWCSCLLFATRQLVFINLLTHVALLLFHFCFIPFLMTFSGALAYASSWTSLFCFNLWSSSLQSIPASVVKCWNLFLNWIRNHFLLLHVIFAPDVSSLCDLAEFQFGAPSNLKLLFFPRFFFYF